VGLHCPEVTAGTPVHTPDELGVEDPRARRRAGTGGRDDARRAAANSPRRRRGRRRAPGRGQRRTGTRRRTRSARRRWLRPRHGARAVPPLLRPAAAGRAGEEQAAAMADRLRRRACRASATRAWTRQPAKGGHRGAPCPAASGRRVADVPQGARASGPAPDARVAATVRIAAAQRARPAPRRGAPPLVHTRARARSSTTRTEQARRGTPSRAVPARSLCGDEAERSVCTPFPAATGRP
jgi:hypothetical protein